MADPSTVSTAKLLQKAKMIQSQLDPLPYTYDDHGAFGPEIWTETADQATALLNAAILLPELAGRLAEAQKRIRVLERAVNILSDDKRELERELR